MRLDKLKIKQWRNFKDFEIDFDETQLTSVLIGENGTGKSNLFEAIVAIFSNFDLSEKPPFEFELCYKCYQQDIRLVGLSSEGGKLVYEIYIMETENLLSVEKRLSKSEIQVRKEKLLPKHIFAYYSGGSHRMEALFWKHQEQYYNRILNMDVGEEAVPVELRRFFFCREIHSQFVLLAYYAFGEKEAEAFLQKYLSIDDLDSVLMVVKQPWWNKPATGHGGAVGNANFWQARGPVSHILRNAYEKAFGPIFGKDRAHDDYRLGGRSEERRYLFLPTKETLQSFAQVYKSAKQFFVYLESTDISDLIREVRIKVKRRDAEGFVTFQELSEGEQQLLTVLGLLKFTRDEEALFLLDEPDTHLNPIWKLHYLSMIEEIVGTSESSQLLISTHDPLTIAGLLRSQVLIFRQQEGRATAGPPDEDPRGLGVQGVLTRLFGLPTTLDPTTQGMLDRRNALYAQPERSEAEDLELTNLSYKLGNMGFLTVARDPDYELFLRALAGQSRPKDRTFTTEELRKIDEVAEEILREIFPQRVPE